MKAFCRDCAAAKHRPAGRLTQRNQRARGIIGGVNLQHRNVSLWIARRLLRKNASF